VLPVMLLLFGASLSWPAVLFVPITLMHLAFTVGVAFALSQSRRPFRDVAHFTEIAIMILVWLNPIVYKARDAPARLQRSSSSTRSPRSRWRITTSSSGIACRRPPSPPASSCGRSRQ